MNQNAAGCQIGCAIAETIKNCATQLYVACGDKGIAQLLHTRPTPDGLCFWAVGCARYFAGLAETMLAKAVTCGWKSQLDTSTKLEVDLELLYSTHITIKDFARQQ